MRSIPQALVWEILHRGRWSLIGGALGAYALPVMLFSALKSKGGLFPEDPAYLAMHMVLAPVGMFTFAAGLFAALGSPSRLYAYPVSNGAIVVWRLLPAMILMLLHTAVGVSMLNAAFDVGWPLWGPALFFAAAYALIQAVIWWTDKSAWLPLAVVAMGLILGVWFKSRHGPAFSAPDHYWREVTWGETTVMLVIVGLAYAVGSAAVRRNRRGEPPLSLGVMAWLERRLHAAPRETRTFRTPADAQRWFEWRRKGWAMPATVLFGTLVGVSGWLIFSRNVRELFELFIAGGAMLMVVGLVGALAIGNCGPSDGRMEIGTFLATRPISTRDLARIILKTAAKSVLLAWSIWAVGFVTSAGIALAAQALPQGEVLKSAWSLPATLFGLWSITAVGASVSLTGRQHVLMKLQCGLIAAFLGWMLLANFALSPETAERIALGGSFVAGVACVLGTAWMFLAARRRSLAGGPTVLAAGGAWSVLAALLAAVWSIAQSANLETPPPLASFVLLAGVGALALAPLAAAPLALAWNRIR